MRNLIERVHCDWDELNNVQEIEIIKEYSAIGRFITFIITCKQYLEFFNTLNSVTSIQTLIVQL